MSETLNIVVAQSPADLFGPQARINWLKTALNCVGDWQVDLLILPELFLTGYNVGEKISEWAEQRDGPLSRQIASLAKTTHMAIHFGYAERDGDNLYNSAACYDTEGNMIDHHRKLLLPPGFEGDHFEGGYGYSQFRIGGFKIATLICYDAEFPENFREVSIAGADLVVVPTALGAQWGVVSEKVVPTRAFENGVFVCYANHCNHENGVSFYGGSCIVGPDGKDIARANRKEKFLFAQLDLDAVKAAQTRLPYHKNLRKLPCR